MAVLVRIGRYELLEAVAHGSTGTVFRGRDTILDREVAVRLIQIELSDDDDGARSRFLQETKTAARLQHRNIATIYEFGETPDGVPYVVTEFLKGQTLAAALRNGPALSLEEKLGAVVQICAGLEHAHGAGIVHRDLRPANIWLSPDGNVKLLDFGMASIASSSTTAAEGSVTMVAYLSPEQVAGKPLDRRSDVFSVGAILYELIAGRQPFTGESPTAKMLSIARDVAPSLQDDGTVPPALLPILERVLDKDPAARYQRAVDLGRDLDDVIHAVRPPVEELTQFVTDVAPPKARTAVAERRTAPANVKPSWIVGGVAAAVVVVAIVLLVLRLSPGKPSESAPGPAPAPGPEPTAIKAETAGTNEPAATPREVPPPPGTRRIAVSSEPAGASVIVDGADRGTTPLTLDIDPAHRPKSVRVVKRGFESRDLALNETVLTNGHLEVSLPVAAPVAVTLSGRYPFEIVQGSRVLSERKDHHEITLEGRQTVRLRAPQVYLDEPMTIDPRNGRTQAIDAPRLGTLVVRTITDFEKCDVWLDSRMVDRPPLRASVAAGHHRLELRCAGDAPRLQDVEVAANNQTITSFQ